jgi:4'-phosphopantetheinyl transferase
MEIYAVKILDMDGEQLDNLSLSIDSKKRYKMGKLIRKEDKIKTLVGEIIIRSIIINKFNVNNKNITFHENIYGKPYLSKFPNVFFNLSHSEDFVVCAFDNYPVGIDIERVKDIEYMDIAENFFTKKEYEYIMKSDFDKQLHKFYDIWTLKESYMKCCGKGLSLPLKSFSVEINITEGIRVLTDSGYVQHALRIVEIEPGYKMAVCTLNEEICPNITMINQKDLISTYYEIACKKQ